MKKSVAALVMLATVVVVAAACRPRPFPPTPPPAPTNVQLVPGDRSITASFDEVFPSVRYGFVQGYRLTCSSPKVFMLPPNSPGWILDYHIWDASSASVEGRRSPLVLDLPDGRGRMANGTTFTCSVEALTRNGVGEPSAPQVVTPVGPPRVAVTVPVQTGPGSALVFVSVDLEGSNRETFRCDVEAPGVVSHASDETCTFSTSGLEPGTEYTATITPRSSLGVGEPYTVTFLTGF